MKPDTIFLIPGKGLIVRDPVTTQPLPVEGAHKPRTAYWLRRLRDGDVVESKPPKAVKTEPGKPKKD